MKYFLLISSMFIYGNLSAIGGSDLLPQEKSGDYVQFLLDGKLYDGYLGVSSDNRLQAEISFTADSEITPDTKQVEKIQKKLEGYLVPEHQDVGLEVYLLGNDSYIEFRNGVVEEVYDNGYQKIGIYSESPRNGGDPIYLFRPEYIIIHKATLMKDGGFTILTN